MNLRVLMVTGGAASAWKDRSVKEVENQQTQFELAVCHPQRYIVHLPDPSILTPPLPAPLSHKDVSSSPSRGSARRLTMLDDTLRVVFDLFVDVPDDELS